jgi:hypothetical protein
LRRSNPRAFDQFLKALSDDLGVGASASSFACPNCNARLEITVAEARTARRGRPTARANARPGRRSTRAGDGLNNFLIELARMRRCTTGTINAQFKKIMGRKIKNLDKKEQRQQKVDWLKSELAKGKAA